MRPIQFAGIAGIALAALFFALRANVVSPGVAMAASGDNAEARVAVCSVVIVTDELMSSDRFRPSLEDNAERLRDELIRPYIEEGKAIEREFRDADPNDPENKSRQQRILELREIILPQQQQRAGVLQEDFVAGKTIEAYELVAASARAVAKDLGFNFVLVSAGAEETLERSGPMSKVRNSILGRPVILFPEEVDITEDVREDLKLD